MGSLMARVTHSGCPGGSNDRQQAEDMSSIAAAAAATATATTTSGAQIETKLAAT